MNIINIHNESFHKKIQKINIKNLHPNIQKLYKSLPEDISDFKNIIFYGPCGCGKYSQVLYLLSQYSPTNLKYEKKIHFTYNKKEFIIKMSDIHFEIDLALLVFSTKLLWHEIYVHITNIILNKTNKIGIIVLKNFDKINNELLEIFYSYMQSINNHLIKIKFIFLTQNISFIPKNIIDATIIISVPRPSLKCLKKTFDNKYFDKQINDYLINKNLIVFNQPLHIMTNTQSLNFTTKIQTKFKENPSVAFVNNKTCLSSTEKNVVIQKEEYENHKPLYNQHPHDCNEKKNHERYHLLFYDIINIIDKYILEKDIDLSYLREKLYKLLVYNFELNELIWFILSNYINNKKIHDKNIKQVLLNIFLFLKYYNNNYRPIYHLELFLLQFLNFIDNEK